LTPIQRKVLGFLQDCDVQGTRPTYRELAARFDWKAVGTARDHLRALSAKGCVELSGGRSRSLKVTSQGRALVQGSTGADPGRSPRANPVEGLAQDLVGLLEPFLVRKRFRSGTCLWHEGDPAQRCIIIDRGRIMAYRQLPSGRTVPTCLRGPGEIVGFPPLFDGSGYPTTVQVLEDLEARVLERTDLLRAVQDGPTALLMFKLFANRLREVFKVVEQVSHRSAVPRVASALLALAPEPPPKGGFTFVSLPLAAGTLATALGLAPETFSRAITQMTAEGILHRLSLRRFQILDLARLRAHAEATDWA
jgi:CRP/FNR family transcriptional regulator